MSFGETLRRLREEAGLTQAALAERAAIPIRTIQGWEQNYRCPVSPDFFRLVKALGAPADAFAESVIPAGPMPKKPKKLPARSRKAKG